VASAGAAGGSHGILGSVLGCIDSLFTGFLGGVDSFLARFLGGTRCILGGIGGLLGSLFSLLGGFLGGIDDRRGRRSGRRLFLLGTGGETNGNQGGEKQGTGIHRKISSRKVKTGFLADRKRP